MIKDNQSNTEEQILNDNMDDISNPNTEQNVDITISNYSSKSKKY